MENLDFSEGLLSQWPGANFFTQVKFNRKSAVGPVALVGAADCKS